MHARSVILLVLAPAMAGCLLPEPPQAAAGYDEDDLARLFNATKNLSLDLDDLGEGHLLLEVVAQSPLSLRIDAALPVREGAGAAGTDVEPATPKACMSVYTPGTRYMVFGMLRMPTLIVSGAGVTEQVRLPAGEVQFTMDHTIESWAYDGHGTPIAIALDRAADWAQAGGTVDATLFSQEPFHWRLREGGSVSCHNVIAQADGGAALDAGSAMVVRDKEIGFHSDGSMFAGIYIGADGPYSATLTGPGLRDEYARTNGYHFGSGRLPEGDYQFHVERLAGTNLFAPPTGIVSGAAAMVHDVPEWVLTPPWQTHNETAQAL